MKLACHERGRIVAGCVLLDRGEPQPRVGDDAVELLHQRRLGERWQLFEGHVRPERVATEQLTVVRGR